MKLWEKFLPIFLTMSLIFPSFILARSGCCSHHGGVCGCRCCDGTSLSTICAPYYPSCNSAPVIIATKIPTLKPVAKPPTNTPKPYPTLKPTILPTITPFNTPTFTTIVTKTKATPSNTKPLSNTSTPINISIQNVLGTEDQNTNGNNGSMIGGIALAGGSYMGYKYLIKRKNR